ncbi:hypothetical protein NQ317_010455 [Molorchus minor]|uniref:Uncharacterized protein n=1 Tax=Molorchus minor TaxID=1323400 RepID=A0ABQ9IW57_9CUCU|nr:hypothetical protein NQ317_010455 [Molorchus minor]
MCGVFPYLYYKNGGGTFLITYSVAMILCGIPMFFQEVAIGQYLGSGGMTFVGQLCPILKGVGYAAMTLVFLLNVYYCIIIAWTLFYIMSSFSALPDLPWSGCDNWWNTDNCIAPTGKRHFRDIKLYKYHLLGISSGITEIEGIQYSLFVCLLLGWLAIYMIVRKGLHQSGKDNLVYGTISIRHTGYNASARSHSRRGLIQGLLYYITPRWEALLTPGPWMDGASQIFFAYSIGCGALPALGSFNKFHHNSYKCNDKLHRQHADLSYSWCRDFLHSGSPSTDPKFRCSRRCQKWTGISILTYPEVVLKLPGAPFWAVSFFIMLLMLGIDSEFCLVEAFITGLLDNWSQQLRPYRNSFTIMVILVMFILGIPMVTHGGMYTFQLMDYYSASGMSLLWVCFFQTIAISWLFGVENLCDCIEQMMGFRPNKLWKICWKYFAPITMLIIFVSQCLQYERLVYGDYKYPLWADIVGLCISFSSMVWIPAYAIYYVLTQPGSIIQNIRTGIQPNIKQRKISIRDETTGQLITQSKNQNHSKAVQCFCRKGNLFFRIKINSRKDILFLKDLTVVLIYISSISIAKVVSNDLSNCYLLPYNCEKIKKIPWYYNMFLFSLPNNLVYIVARLQGATGIQGLSNDFFNSVNKKEQRLFTYLSIIIH